MPKFYLEINLGNDAMKKAHQLGDALDTVEYLVRHQNNYDIIEPCKHTIRDCNGNVVGFYEVR